MLKKFNKILKKLNKTNATKKKHETQLHKITANKEIYEKQLLEITLKIRQTGTDKEKEIINIYK